MSATRRHFLATAPLSLPVWAGASTSAAMVPISATTGEPSAISSQPIPLLASPPVVQWRTETGFTVTWKVSSLATGWVEWGTRPDQLSDRAIAQHNGLVDAHDRVLQVRVNLAHPDQPVGPDGLIFYRVVAQPLAYTGGQILRGQPEFGEIRPLRPLPGPNGPLRVAIINDTHENAETLTRLAARLEVLDPDWLIWNGDSGNDFHADADVAEILLGNGRQDTAASGGWASTRPLSFLCGNHDARGARARELPRCFPPNPDLAGQFPHLGPLPYNGILRLGPLALILLDTGEDKPDAHPNWGGTVACEPYREDQAHWLRASLVDLAQGSAGASESTESAPNPPLWTLACCHIPLRGLPGQPDGQSLENLDEYARWSGHGARLWLPLLQEAGVAAIISGHTHQPRIDPATADAPAQVVGGGPQPERATIILIEVDAAGDHADEALPSNEAAEAPDSPSAPPSGPRHLQIRIEDLDGHTLHSLELPA